MELKGDVTISRTDTDTELFFIPPSAVLALSAFCANSFKPSPALAEDLTIPSVVLEVACA